MSEHRSYDADFYGWTRQQAARLRQIRDSVLDTERLAEEVEDLGRAERRAVKRNLTAALQRLLQAAWLPSADSHMHWRAEATTFARHARDAFSPGMRQHLDLGEIWEDACVDADKHLRAFGDAPLPRGLACPFGLDELLVRDLDDGDAVARIQAVMRARSGSP